MSESFTDPINIYWASPMYKTLTRCWVYGDHKLSCFPFLGRLYSSGRVRQPINRQISQLRYYRFATVLQCKMTVGSERTVSLRVRVSMR